MKFPSESTPVKKGIVTFYELDPAVFRRRKAPRLRRGLWHESRRILIRLSKRSESTPVKKGIVTFFRLILIKLAHESESTPVKKGIVTFYNLYIGTYRHRRKAPRLRRGLWPLSDVDSTSIWGRKAPRLRRGLWLAFSFLFVPRYTSESTPVKKGIVTKLWLVCPHHDVGKHPG